MRCSQASVATADLNREEVARLQKRVAELEEGAQKVYQERLDERRVASEKMVRMQQDFAADKAHFENLRADYDKLKGELSATLEGCQKASQQHAEECMKVIEETNNWRTDLKKKLEKVSNWWLGRIRRLCRIIEGNKQKAEEEVASLQHELKWALEGNKREASEEVARIRCEQKWAECRQAVREADLSKEIENAKSREATLLAELVAEKERSRQLSLDAAAAEDKGYDIGWKACVRLSFHVDPAYPAEKVHNLADTGGSDYDKASAAKKAFLKARKAELKRRKEAEARRKAEREAQATANVPTMSSSSPNRGEAADLGMGHEGK